MSDEISKHVLKTGTLTIGIVCKEGIVIAADRRLSYGSDSGVRYIAEQDKKIAQVNERVIVTTAGVASDSDKIIGLTRAELRLKELKTKVETSIKETAHLFSNIVYQHIRQPSIIPGITHFLVAGYDKSGASLYNVSPDGHLKIVNDYAATGAGFFQADPILDSEYKKEITIQEGVKLAIKCITASMGREPSVGDGLDIYVVKKDSINQLLSQEVISELKNDN